MSCRVSLVIFEGGKTGDSLVKDMMAVRKQVVLDSIEKVSSVPQIHEVVVATNFEDLALEVQAMGATVELTGTSGFHFGQRLRDVITRHGMEAVIYMGGASAPLISAEDLKLVAAGLSEGRSVVYSNNLQSADIIAFRPASAIQDIDPPGADNLLGWLLREAGLELKALPGSARFHFDIDTPTDLVILSLQPDTGPRAKRELERLNWPPDRVARARDRLSIPMSEIVLIGRVGPRIVTFINDHFQCRLRVFSEERGMKALGRDTRGEVVSFLGLFLDEHGPEGLFRYIGRIGHAAFIDSRVMMAHGGRTVSDHDRYNSDLGRSTLIADPRVRSFTEAAMGCPVPVVLGGHSVVNGGLRLLAENILGGSPCPA
jgi:hypothetical protein